MHGVHLDLPELDERHKNIAPQPVASRAVVEVIQTAPPGSRASNGWGLGQDADEPSALVARPVFNAFLQDITR